MRYVEWIALWIVLAALFGVAGIVLPTDWWIVPLITGWAALMGMVVCIIVEFLEPNATKGGRSH